MYWIGIDQLSVQALFRTSRKDLSGKPPNRLRLRSTLWVCPLGVLVSLDTDFVLLDNPVG